MNPESSRIVAITVSRDKLARAMMRLDQLVHTATAALSTLAREKSELGARNKELTELLEQERSLARQREKLFSSNKGESEQHKNQLAELKAKLAEHETLAKEQTRTIATMERDLDQARRAQAELATREETGSAQLATLESTMAGLNSQLATIVSERDALKQKLAAKAKEEAGQGLTLSKDELKLAIKTVESLSKTLDAMEEKVVRANASVPAAEPDIFQQA